MNIYLSIGCIYKYDLAEWLIKHKDVDEIYMDYYESFDKKYSLSNKSMHYIPMDVFRRHDAANHIDVREYSMPGKEVLSKALKYESMAIHLGMRETNYPVHTYEESKRAYLFFLRLWNHWMDEINPGLIFFEETPHCMSIYVMYVIARIRGIRVLIINPTGIRLDNYSGGVYVYGDSISRLGYNIGEMYERIKEQKIESFEIKGKIKEYFERSLNGNNESSSSLEDRKQWAKFVYDQEFRSYAKPFYNIRYYYALLRLQVKHLMKKNVNHTEKSVLIRRRELNRRARHYIRKYSFSLKEYESTAILPDYNEKFVYFPLQQMPEMTLFPLAASYGEQYNTIQMLSRITDCFDIKIFVKEYYIQPYRDINFWNDVRKLKNVELISSSVSSNELMKHCIAVASQTGTSLMEAVFEGKPALAFGGGHNWKGMPGLIEIENEVQGKNEIRKILQGFSVDIADVKKYFYCIQENSIEYYIKRDYSVEKNEAYEDTLNDLKRIIGHTIDDMHQ